MTTSIGHRKANAHTAVIRAFCKAVGGKSPSEAVDRVCDQLLERLARTAPPFQSPNEGYYAIARLLAIPVIEDDIRADGTLSRIGNRFIIRVKGSACAARKNFTVCHEIGHAEILRRAREWHQEEHGRPLDGTTRSREEEFLAHRFAANLLMPSECFAEHACALAPSLSSLAVLADRFATSLEAAAKRLTDLDLWRCAFMLLVPGRINGELAVETHTCYNSKSIQNPFGTCRYWSVPSVRSKGTNDSITDRREAITAPFSLIHDVDASGSSGGCVFRVRSCEGGEIDWRCECKAISSDGVRYVLSFLSCTFPTGRK